MSDPRFDGSNAALEILAKIPGLSPAAQSDIIRHIAEIRQLRQNRMAEDAATKMVELSHRYDWCLTEIMSLFG